MPSPTRNERHERGYRLRILAATAASLGLVVAAFSLWPSQKTAPILTYAASPQEYVPLELIEPTLQSPRAAPPPPPTLPPIEVPDDPEILDEPIEFEELDTAPSLEEIALPAPPGPVEDEGEPAGPIFVENPDRTPQARRHPIPVRPPEAERRDIRARVRFRVKVDERGRIQDIALSERLLVDKKGRETVVEEIGYGIEEAALDVVQRVRFRPGRHDGQRVQTYTNYTVSFGI